MTTDHRAEGAVQALEDTADEVGRVREAIRLAQGVISPPHIAMILAGYDQAEGVIREQAAKLRGADHDRPRPPAPPPPGRTLDMTINHRAEAERLLIDADEWGKQAEEPTPEAGELSCLAFAAVHALLAIHDTLAALKPKPTTYPWPSTLPGVDAADRYAANEARQREEAEPDPRDDASIEEVLALAAKASRRWARTLELLKQAEEEESEQQWEDAARAFADPLDEDDHRDRIDGDGQRWCRMDGGCWHHEGKYPHGFGRCSWTLQQLQGAYGLLAFAPDAPPDAPRADLSASQGESGDEGGGEAKETAEPLLCGECEHLIDYHTRYVRCEIVRCPCTLQPSDIARKLIEQAGGRHG